MLRNLHLDPALDAGAATGALLGTAADLTLRLKEYLLFPYKLCTLCGTWFPETFQQASVEFLVADPGALDVGCSLFFKA